MMQQQQQQQSTAAVDKQFNDECIEAHNHCRALHGCPPLALSPQLASSAQAWANHLASIGQLKHSTPNPKGSYGENVAMKMVSGSTEYKGSQCTAQWYSEIEMYNFDGGENQMKCGHFSQVVWKDVKEAGFGKAISPDGKMFAVGQYSPPGNFMNKWRANIPAPLSGQIKVPTHEDIMGRTHEHSKQPQQQQQQQQPQQQQQHRAQPIAVSQSNAGHVRVGQDADQQDTEPKPADPRDRPVGKATKTRIVNGEKTVTVTVTFARPDGSRYQLAKETSESRAAQTTSATSALKQQEVEPEMIRPAQFRRNFAAPPTTAAAEEEGGDRDDVDGELEEKRATFGEEMARVHSQLRSRHGAPGLSRSESLDRLAQAWADSLCRSRDLRHSRSVAYGNGQVGQNIAKRPADMAEPGGKSTSQQLAQQWYAERHHFPFGDPDPQDISGGHFSQQVWCSSEKLGVGLALDRETGDEYAVCFYYPSGNLAGQFAQNVLPSDD